MKRNGQASMKMVGLVVSGVLVLGGGAWAIMGGSAEPDSKTNLPKELTLSSMKQQAEAEPDKMMDTMRDLRRREDLTEEQKEEAGRNMRKVWEDMLNKNVDNYYAATTDEEKQKILDAQIDEFAERMKQMEERRKQWEAEREAERKAKGESEETEEQRREQMRRRMGGQTREERKDRSEARDPDKAARTMAYFMAVQKRMSERGIEMPRGMMGPRGGGPGGRGGPGGGRG